MASPCECGPIGAYLHSRRCAGRCTPRRSGDRWRESGSCQCRSKKELSEQPRTLCPGQRLLFDGGTKGGNAGLHLPVDLVDGCIDGIDLTEMQAQQKAVAVRDTPAKGFTQALLGSLHARI